MSRIGPFPTPWRKVSTTHSKGYGPRSTYEAYDDNEARLRAVANGRSDEPGVLDWTVQDVGGGLYRATVNISGQGTESNEELNEPIIEARWAVTNDEVDRSIFDHWRTRAIEEIFPGTVYYVQAQADKFFKSPTPGTATITVPGLTVEANADANKLYRLIIGGTEAFGDDIPVLQKITILPAGSNKALAWANAGRIFSDEELAIAEPTIPAGIKTGLPTGFYKKRNPTCSQLADGSLEARVVYQYVGRSFSDYLYEGPA